MKRTWIVTWILLPALCGETVIHPAVGEPVTVASTPDKENQAAKQLPLTAPAPFLVDPSLQRPLSNNDPPDEPQSKPKPTSEATEQDKPDPSSASPRRQLPPVETRTLTDQADQPQAGSADPAHRDSKDAGQSQAEAPQLRPRMQQLRDRIQTCLRIYYRPENIQQRSPWGVMHSLLGYGVDTEVIISADRRVNAIGWLCWNQPCHGMKMLYLENGQVQTRHGPGYQGHEGQFLSMLALSKVPVDFGMKIDGQALTVMDLVKHEQRTCRPKSELTFKLIGISHYLDSDTTWTCDQGLSWDIPRLINEELAQPVIGACCGGTHRLMGLSVAVHTREKRDEPVQGEWLRAKKFVDAYHKYAIKLQNDDGSFSTQWFRRRENSGDPDRKLQTTGHILEWLIYSLPKRDLTDPRVIRAVNYLADLMLRHRDRDWEIGPRGHALHALAMYNERVFGDKPGQRAATLARRPQD